MLHRACKNGGFFFSLKSTYNITQHLANIVTYIVLLEYSDACLEEST
jgi:hypothetical protein